MKKEQSFLDEDANNISILKKEISKQSQIDVSVQTSINQKIESLKQNAAVLAKKLQNQKHKNIQLQMIINHMRIRMEKDKLQEASTRQNSNFQSITVLENKFKKFQYDLGQLNSKANKISENVEQKHNKINQIRTQRVIDSGIFRNIEKQLIQSELKFKKLLIQKIKYQKQYEKLLMDYKNLKERAQNLNGNNANKTKSSDPDNTFMLELSNNKETFSKKFTNLQVKDSPYYKTRTLTNLQYQMQFQQQQKCIKIHKILNDLGLENAEQLMTSYLSIDDINQKYFNQINVYNDQISEIEKYIVTAQQVKNKQRILFGHHEKQLSKDQILFLQSKKLKVDIQLTQKEKKQQIQQITSFYVHIRLFQKQENFQVFLKKINVQDDLSKYDENNFEDLTDLLKVIQTKMDDYLVQPGLQITKRTEKHSNKSQQKLEDMINLVKKPDECLKIMKKEDFQDEYNKIMKANNKKSSSKAIPKRKSNQFIKQ